VAWEECLKHRKDVVLPTVKESNPGGGHCEPRKATKDRWAGNVGGTVTAQVQLLPGGVVL